MKFSEFANIIEQFVEEESAKAIKLGVVLAFFQVRKRPNYLGGDAFEAFVAWGHMEPIAKGPYVAKSLFYASELVHQPDPREFIFRRMREYDRKSPEETGRQPSLPPTHQDQGQA